MTIGITHSFVNPKADGPDATITRPSDWNAAHALTGLGTGVETALGVNVGSAGAIIVNGGALGTPSTGTLTNATGLPDGGLSLTDITTNNSSTSKHGFLLKLNNSATSYMDGTGAWSTPGSSLTSGTTAVSGGANYAVLREDGSAKLIADSTLLFGGAAAGTGFVSIAGTATTAVPMAAFSQGQNNAGVVFPGFTIAASITAAAAGSAILNVLGGAAGATSRLLVDNSMTTISTSVLLTGGSTLFRANELVSNNNGLISYSGNPIGWASGVVTATSTADTAFYRISAGNIGASTGGASGTAGNLSLTNLTTAATSSTGTAAIIDGSNVLRPLTSSERFKTNMRDWVPSAKEISAFLSLPQMLFDYQDQPARIEPERVIPAVIEKQPSPILDSKGNAPLVDVIVEPEQVIPAWEIEPARQGVKDVLGLSAEKIDAAGLSWLVNYDAQGMPYSLREHGVLSFLIALVKQQQDRIAALEAA